jgi:group I intron endonuclease
MKKEKICGIYCFENKKNRKKYVGQSIDIVNRLSSHKWEFNKGKENKYFQRALEKYGFEGFYFYPLEECENDSKILDDLEKYYIDLYDTTNPKFGYNIEKGGNKPPNVKGIKRSKETRELMSRVQQVVAKDPERRRKISIGNSGENHWNYGNTTPTGTRKKISDALKVEGAHPLHGVPMPQETRDKISVSRTGKPSNNPWTKESREMLSISKTGIEFSEEWVENMSKSQIGKKQKTDGYSHYHGVTWHKLAKMWYCVIRYGRKQHYVGRYKTELEAAKAYDKKCWEIYQNLSMLNFPEDYEGV